MKKITAILLSAILVLSLFTLPVSAATIIESVSISVVAPEAGRNPRYEYTTGNNTYVVDDENGIAWFNGDNAMSPDETFKPGNKYTVYVDLCRASEEYSFRVNPYIDAKINGNDAYISYVNSNYAVICYEFPVIQGHKVTFTANGGTGTMAPAEDVAGDYVIPECSFTPPANKVFKCWLREDTGEEWYPGEKAPVYNDMTLKALWKSVSTRNVIYNVVATSDDMDNIPVLYGKHKIPDFTITEGAPAYINASTSNFRWQKEVDGVWKNQEENIFTAGRWRASTSVRIDGEDGTEYELGDPTTLTVNGESWTADNGTGKPMVYDTYSVIFFNSPVYTIEDDPDIVPPVFIENVVLRTEGYEGGLPVSEARVVSDENINIDSVIFAEAVDYNNDGEFDGMKEATGNFSTEKTYLVNVRFTAEIGYDISNLNSKKVSMENSCMEAYGGYYNDDEYFEGLYMLNPAEAHQHSMLIIITPATTKENGRVQHFCEFCSEFYIETVAKIKEVKLSKTSYTYDGKVKKPSVTVTDAKGKKLTLNKDYTVSYPSGRKNVGSYSVKITFKNNYKGKVTKNFTIVPKSTKIKSLTKGTKKITVKWNKQTTQTTGYQIQYSTESNFKGAKTSTITKNKTTSKTINKLASNKKYYVRIRTYKTVSGNKYYSSWSSAKSIKSK